jgi:hypothetical protein
MSGWPWRLNINFLNSLNKILEKKIHLRAARIVQDRSRHMLDFRLIKRLLLHILPNGHYRSIRLLVLLLAGHTWSRNGPDGFRHVHTLLHKCEPVPLDYELLEHDWIRFKGQ